MGGGAARGFAHVGVIAVLEEAGLRPSVLVGTSAGSLVAALYASGKTSAQLQQTALNMEEVAITDWMLPIFGRGMFRGEALSRYVNDLVAGRLIEKMSIPLGIVATDLNSGQAVLFQRGDTGLAVRASSAVPAVFVPVKINGREYVDGGLVSPVPVRFARQMGAELVIAVDISSPPEGNPAEGTLQILLQTFAIMGKSINRYELRDADLVIQPSQAGLKSADFSARQRAIDAGRAAMLAALPGATVGIGGSVAVLLIGEGTAADASAETTPLVGWSCQSRENLEVFAKPGSGLNQLASRPADSGFVINAFWKRSSMRSLQ